MGGPSFCLRWKVSNDWLSEPRRQQGLDPERITDPVAIAKLSRLIREERRRQGAAAGREELAVPDGTDESLSLDHMGQVEVPSGTDVVNLSDLTPDQREVVLALLALEEAAKKVKETS